MITVFKLVNKYFWKGIIGPLFAFVVPIILLFFIGLILGHEFYFPAGISVSILTVGLVFMPQSIFEFKNSTLLKRIGTTPINPIKFLIVIVIFNFIIMIVSMLLVFIFSFLVFFNNLHSSKMESSFEGQPLAGASWFQMLSGVEWGSFIYSTFLLIFLTMVVGILLASVARSTLFIQGVGITILIITFFVGPAVLPIGMTAQIDAIKYSSYLLPFKYPISLMIESFNGFEPTGTINGVPISYIMNLHNSNIWDINTDYVLFNVFSSMGGNEPGELIVFRSYDKVLNHIMPFFFMALFGFFAVGKFSWSTRSASKMNWKVFNIVRLINRVKKNGEIVALRKANLLSEYLIEAHNVTKTFTSNGEKFNANEDITINFKAGEHVAILGSNGAGKTVFIEQMIGLNMPTSGSFQYNYKTKINYQEALGIQFQNSSYPPGLKCKDIVLFLKEAYHVEISNEELEILIQEFGVNKFYNKSAHSLSGGQQQRLNLMLAIMHKPKLVFLDELSTGLDIKIRTTIKKFIKRFAAENNMTIVVISHDMAEVDYLADRIIVFQSGKVVVDDMKANILKKNKDLEVFLEPYL
ncbi:MAG: ATP-binding cassette domain-containing protein [Metamycoplasmataceae bacterium]